MKNNADKIKIALTPRLSLAALPGATKRYHVSSSLALCI